MNKKLIGLFTGVALFGLTMSAPNAAFISSNFVDNGDYTTDLVSGLDWLDMSYTNGLSYNTVLSMIGGSSLTGWSVATGDQVDALFNNASSLAPLPIGGSSGTHVYVDGTSYYSEAAGLINLLGATNSGVSSGGLYSYDSIRAYIDQQYTPTTHWASALSALTYFDNAFPGVGYLYTNDVYYLNNAGGSAFVGTFLVRESSVPEPSSLLLMGIGLAGLGFVRRRKRA
jgi:hypothetical protein